MISMKHWYVNQLENCKLNAQGSMETDRAARPCRASIQGPEARRAFEFGPRAGQKRAQIN